MHDFHTLVSFTNDTLTNLLSLWTLLFIHMEYDAEYFRNHSKLDRHVYFMKYVNKVHQ